MAAKSASQFFSVGQGSIDTREHNSIEQPMDNALSRLPLELRSMICGLLTQPDMLSLLRIGENKYEAAHPCLYKDGIINSGMVLPTRGSLPHPQHPA